MGRQCAGQVGWIAQRLAVKERRARLLGLDAPRRTDVAISAPALRVVEIASDVHDAI